MPSLSRGTGGATGSSKAKCYDRLLAGKPVSLTLQVLREIRERKGTNTRLDRVEQRVGAVGQRVGGVELRIEGVGRRQTETEVRLAIELVAVAKAVGEVRDLLRDRLDDRARVD
jgi:hypothetical protein